MVAAGTFSAKNTKKVGQPNAESTALGRMFKGDGGEVVERLEGWTRVQSGNVNVSADRFHKNLPV